MGRTTETAWRERRHRVWPLEAGTPHDRVVMEQLHRKGNCPPQAPDSDFPNTVARSGSRFFRQYLMGDISITPSVSVASVIFVRTRFLTM